MLRAWRSCGWWGVLDTVGHAVRPPRWLQRPICDYYDIAAGYTRADLIAMDYNGRAPWWLR